MHEVVSGSLTDIRISYISTLILFLLKYYFATVCESCGVQCVTDKFDLILFPNNPIDFNTKTYFIVILRIDIYVDVFFSRA